MGTRENILDAALRIMRTEGYARATTKEIARAAGYSEAALYKHFRDKTEIFLSVLAEQLPGLSPLIARLGQQVGTRTVRANLEELVATAVAFYVESFPVAASLFSSRQLLAAHRERLAELGAGGPRAPQDALARYLGAERDLGRIAPDADPDALAALLLGACFQQGFLASFTGAPPTVAEREALARRLVTAVVGATHAASGA
ncbi:TetR/AcrR family transcriptional regulator [Pseudonocardia nigra]|uniref:TetR/AcrR family transcriptional regulator n=1 Tax=Pseudonocardia nigra TaxID=1921578 RepID=UPI001C5D2040|nr:TetR/AcrR family transcriptional regulator [Pseudonocardia nigra]